VGYEVMVTDDEMVRLVSTCTGQDGKPMIDPVILQQAIPDKVDWSATGSGYSDVQRSKDVMAAVCQYLNRGGKFRVLKLLLDAFEQLGYRGDVEIPGFNYLGPCVEGDLGVEGNAFLNADGTVALAIVPGEYVDGPFPASDVFNDESPIHLESDNRVALKIIENL
jgi:hypothetical protein